MCGKNQINTFAVKKEKRKLIIFCDRHSSLWSMRLHVLVRVLYRLTYLINSICELLNYTVKVPYND